MTSDGLAASMLPPGTTFVIGGPDTGKSTLAQRLYAESAALGPAAFLDADIGQSTLAVPTTMALAVTSPADQRSRPGYLYFVGSISPRGHMLQMLVGVHRLQRKALQLGCARIVVDTTGLIDPAEGGAALKQAKIELLAPSLIIGLARNGELDPILAPWRRHPGVRVLGVRPSERARARNRGERVARRRELWRAYFSLAGQFGINLNEYPIFDLTDPQSQLVLALQDAEGYTLALARTLHVGRPARALLIESPIPSLASVGSLRFGMPGLDAMVNGSA